jgi:hypothetical protein
MHIGADDGTLLSCKEEREGQYFSAGKGR